MSRMATTATLGGSSSGAPAGWSSTSMEANYNHGEEVEGFLVQKVDAKISL